MHFRSLEVFGGDLLCTIDEGTKALLYLAAILAVFVPCAADGDT